MKTTLIIKGVTPVTGAERRSLNVLFWADKDTDSVDDIEAAELIVNITNPDVIAEFEEAWRPEVEYREAMEAWQTAKQTASNEGQHFDVPEPDKPAPVHYSADFGRVTD